MHHALVSTDEIMGEAPVRLGADESRQMRSVLRVAVGDETCLLDGHGHKRFATVAEVSKAGVICALRGSVETLPRALVNITLFQCVAKPSRMDWLIEKAVELGVSTIVPIVSSRSVVRIAAGEKQDRWQRIAESALRQCGGGWLPEIAPPVKWDAAVERMRQFDGSIFIGALSGNTRPLGDVLMDMRMAGHQKNVGWLIGPEGDFSPEEFVSALALSCAVPVSLGSQVLRVETAALYGISATMAMLGTVN